MTIHRSDRHDFVYVQTDIPDGIAIGDWRAQRAAELMALRSARRWRRRRRLWRRIARPRWPRHVGGHVVRG
jgi:hypothetical protein